MKTKLCRPVLVEAKDNKNRIYPGIFKHSYMFGDDRGKIGYYDCNIRTPTVAMELVLVSLDPNDKVKTGDTCVALKSDTSEDVDKICKIKEVLKDDSHNFLADDGHRYSDSYLKKVVATQDQLPPEYIQKFIEEYNKGEINEVEIEVENCGTEDSTCGLIEHTSTTGEGFYMGLRPKLTNGFITIIEPERGITITNTDKAIDAAELIIRRFNNHAKIHGYPSKSFKERVKKYLLNSKPIYTEEEVRNLLIERHNRFTTSSVLVNSILLEQDLKWFEENKK